MFIDINFNSNPISYWSSPKNYFDNLKNIPKIKYNELKENEDKDYFIVGGGSITKNTINELNSFNKKRPETKLIAWGLGLNLFDYTNDKIILPEFKQARGLKLNFFKNFELQGLRDFGMNFDYDWVPCASCLHPFFQKYKKVLPKKKVGILHNSNMDKIRGVDPEDYMSIKSFDIDNILKFIANFEFIISNSYYGVYWAQLLNKKVICLPVKYSLINLRYQPLYLKPKHFSIANVDDAIKLNKNVFEMCPSTPNFLDESIEVNYEFNAKVKSII